MDIRMFAHPNVILYMGIYQLCRAVGLLGATLQLSGVILKIQHDPYAGLLFSCGSFLFLTFWVYNLAGLGLSDQSRGKKLQMLLLLLFVPVSCLLWRLDGK